MPKKHEKFAEGRTFHSGLHLTPFLNQNDPYLLVYLYYPSRDSTMVVRGSKRRNTVMGVLVLKLKIKVLILSILKTVQMGVCGDQNLWFGTEMGSFHSSWKFHLFLGKNQMTLFQWHARPFKHTKVFQMSSRSTQKGWIIDQESRTYFGVWIFFSKKGFRLWLLVAVFGGLLVIFWTF